MSFADDWLKNGLPTFNGGKDKSSARSMINRLGGPQGFKTDYRVNADGSITTVQLKGNMPPQISTTKVSVKKPDGTWVDILSGATRDFTDPVSFNPTQNAYTYALHGTGTITPGSFSPTPTLTTQNQSVIASSFTGLMAKVVQLMLGYQTTLDFSVPVTYQSTWSTTYGISSDSLGKRWLVRISKNDGVLATLLPLIPGSDTAYANTPLDSIREAVKLFGGLPSGGSFPSGSALNAALANGTVKRLATATDMLPYYNTNAPSETLGWSFNLAGSEAHNTSCWVSTTPSYHLEGGHFKLSIDIDAGTATLTLVESGMLFRGLSSTYSACYYSSPSGTLRGWGWDAAYTASVTGTISGPLFVCHINDTVEVVHDAVNNDPHAASWKTYATSTSHSDNTFFYSSALETTWSGLEPYIMGGAWKDSVYYGWTRVYVGTVHTVSTVLSRAPRFALFPYQVRDAYILFEEGLHTTTTTNTHYGEQKNDLTEYHNDLKPDPPYPTPPPQSSDPTVIEYSINDSTIRHVGAPSAMALVTEPFSQYWSTTWGSNSSLSPYQIGFSVFGNAATGFYSYRYAENIVDGNGNTQQSKKVATVGTLLSGEAQGGEHVYNFVGFV